MVNAFRLIERYNRAALIDKVLVSLLVDLNIVVNPPLNCGSLGHARPHDLFRTIKVDQSLDVKTLESLAIWLESVSMRYETFW